jgi:uncharacterized membrane protein SpoIIM required for sporulation
MLQYCTVLFSKLVLYFIAKRRAFMFTADTNLLLKTQKQLIYSVNDTLHILYSGNYTLHRQMFHIKILFHNELCILYQVPVFIVASIF